MRSRPFSYQLRSAIPARCGSLSRRAWATDPRLCVTARGLTASGSPCGRRTVQSDFDVIAQRVVVQTSDGSIASVAREPQSVRKFYGRLMADLTQLDLRVKIDQTPDETADPIRF